MVRLARRGSVALVGLVMLAVAAGCDSDFHAGPCDGACLDGTGDAALDANDGDTEPASDGIDTGGGCNCEAGELCCDGVCANLSTDAAHCGACGAECARSEICEAGACFCEPSPGAQGRVCDTAGSEACCPGQGCVDFSTSVWSCGGCGVECNPGEQCVSGLCTCGFGTPCAAGQSCCDGACCSAGEVCCGGQCAQSNDPICDCGGVFCSPGQTCCGPIADHTCAALSTATDHCGVCGRACGPNAICALGGCECATGFGDCNADVTDGCEVSLASDPQSCGVCGFGCGAGESCEAGACVCPGDGRACGSGTICCAQGCVSATLGCNAQTSCGISVTPPSGSLDTEFAVATSSNGSGCAWTLNGLEQGSMPCAGTVTLLGAVAGVGTHRIGLVVGDGPTGPGACEAQVQVTSSAQTSCSATITPAQGDSSTVFRWTGISNGTSCEWFLDGVRQGPAPCDTSQQFTGHIVGTGTHTVRLGVLDGPSGPSSCQATFTVAEATWCDIDISPITGDMATTFQFSAQGNGQGCTVLLDDVPLTSIPCETPTPIPFLGHQLGGPGQHAVTVQATHPTLGDAQCTATVTVADGSWCALTFAPTSGDMMSRFTGTLAGNGTGCTVSIDGGPAGGIPCQSATPFNGYALGPAGSHTFDVVSNGGPTGQTQCGAVIDVVSSTWCHSTVTPSVGSSSTSFEWFRNSSGATCTWSYDGSPFQSITCGPETFPFAGGDVGPGTHSVSFRVTNGPTPGTETCTTTFTVN